MKYLQDFRVYEYISNRLEARHYMLRLRAAFEKLPKELGVEIIDSTGERMTVRANVDSPLFKKMLDNLAREYKKAHLLLSYEIFKRSEFGRTKVAIELFIKQERTLRVKPTGKVYHYSRNENRESILLNGLVPQTTDKWGPSLKYNPAIFATQQDKASFYGIAKGYDKWEIDTTVLPNKWWADLNFYHGEYDEQPNHVMTYEPIPPSAIRLVQVD